MDTMIIRDAIEALQGLSRRDGHGCHKNGLKILCSIAEGNPGMTYHLNHPGVSLNKMSMPEIDKLLEMLPENVWIWNKT